MSDQSVPAFHGHDGVPPVLDGTPGKTTVQIDDWQLVYRFYSHLHPFVPQLVDKLVSGGVLSLQAADTLYEKTGKRLIDGRREPDPMFYEEFFGSYVPVEQPDPEKKENAIVASPHPVRDLDFTSGGSYAVYNWELFFHIPLTIGMHLSKNQRFQEAQRWFHFVFDPTNDGPDPAPERFWKVRPFHTNVVRLEELLSNLASSKPDSALLEEVKRSIDAWINNPFRPHVVARQRPVAYMWKTVMAYLDNLIAWGDSLFRQDTAESIDEALQLYILSAQLLGPRPQRMAKLGTRGPQTYASLRANPLGNFNKAVHNLENAIPTDTLSAPDAVADRLNEIQSLVGSPYFCVPRNDKVLGYWDTVADRLFKIRNSLNFKGIFRDVPLFDPPIDPALLARAAAAGLDVSAIVSGLNQPLPLVRFHLLLQKAVEICQEVRSLGSNLLSTIEKEDNEALAILRARHESSILELVEMVRYAQLQETIKAREGLERSLESAAQRYIHYERLLGRQAGEIKIPAELDDLDVPALEKLRFQAREPQLILREVAVDIAGGEVELVAGRKVKVSPNELEELNLLEQARSRQDDAAAENSTAQKVGFIPQFSVSVSHPVGTGFSMSEGSSFGGQDLAKIWSLKASNLNIEAERITYAANRSGKIGAYGRREQEWAFQSNVAVGEINQIYKQLRAAQIREAIAEREWKNYRKQIRNAKEVEEFLTEERKGKRTNKDFYAWMKREVKGLYAQCFQFAFEIAKKAERALQHELGDPMQSFLQVSYLAGREGLLAGERLFMDLKRMEMAYHDLNQREYELTKHVSLLQVDPEALLRLRVTGSCELKLEEHLFDFDCPGHYFRRIKSVALSIPCVAGPYTSINCTLTLLRSSVRKSPNLLNQKYKRADGAERAEDPRFSDSFSSMQSIVTSSGQNDSGLFETNLRDERYLPFEGSGAISTWKLDLPGNVRQFDYDTIADVILHLRYTARAAGGQLQGYAEAELSKLIQEANAVGSVRLLSVRHEFPAEWAKFRSQPSGSMSALSVELREEHYPFWSKGKLTEKEVTVVIFARKAKSGVVIVKYDMDHPGQELGPAFGDFVKGSPIGKAALGKFSLFLDKESISNLWFAVTWGA